MSTVPDLNLVSIQDYLKAELESEVKHEYLGGVVLAMSGGRNRHNLVATNTCASLWSRLRGQRCRAFNSDTKVRVRMPGHTRFYYPDVLVACHLNPPDDTYQDEPVLLAEVLSESTRRTDMGEKADAYRSISTLQIYLLIEPEIPAVVAFRRGDGGFEREVYQGLGSVVPLPFLGIELPLSEIYEAVAEQPAS